MCPYRYRRWKFERWYCHDIINYQITERICKNVWKRTSPPLPSTKAAWPRGECAGACNPEAPSSTPSYQRSYVCIMHDETKTSRGLNITTTSRGLNWEKTKHTSWKSLCFDPNKSRFFCLICLSPVTLTGSLGRPSAFHCRISKGSARTLMRLNSSDTGIPSSLQRCIHDDISSLRYRLVNAPKYATQAAATKTFPTTLPISSSNAWKKWE